MIDFHTHPVLIREFAEKYPDYTRMAREVFQIGNNLQPLETFFLQMDVAGIERAVLLPIACARARGLAVSSNGQVAELCGMSKRFIGFASVDPVQPGAAKELESAIQTMGLKGLKLDAALQDFDLNDPKVFEVYEAAAALGIPALIHTGMSWAPGTPLAQGQPLLLEPAIRRFPRLNFVLAHWAWPWVWDANALALKYPNVYLDTSCFYYDGPTEFFQFHFRQQMPITLLERSLRNQIVFGSNYPRVEIKNPVKAIKSLGLTEACLEKIFRTNAEKLLGIETQAAR
ncbi:MAG: amidohydrolase family protein [Terriglobia bacterium]|jgi:predicted TIM-barrel fold metal-dependent hydrolase